MLCSYIIDEFHEVVTEKFDIEQSKVDKFFLELPYELVYTPHKLPEHDMFSIRDKDDEKVLYAAVTADVDILVTGDKDFYDIDIERPHIMSPADFLREYKSKEVK